MAIDNISTFSRVEDVFMSFDDALPNKRYDPPPTQIVSPFHATNLILFAYSMAYRTLLSPLLVITACASHGTISWQTHLKLMLMSCTL